MPNKVEPGLVNALLDPQFRRDVGQGTTNALNRGFVAGTLGAPMDGLMVIANLLQAANGFVGTETKKAFGMPATPPDLYDPARVPLTSEWIGNKIQQAGLIGPERNQLAEMSGGLLGALLPGGLAARSAARNPISRAPVDGRMSTSQTGVRSSRTPGLLDPKPTAQRSFHDDYQQGVAGPDGSRLAFDIEGRPLTAQYVAGRRVAGGVDEALGRGDSLRVADLLGIRRGAVSRSGPDLKGDAGRYIGGHDRRLFVDQSLDSDKAARVFEHELGHAIDDLVFRSVGPRGSRIPTDGLSKELSRVYEDLNTQGWFKPGRGATPKGQGYAQNQTDAELMAEAIRAYMRDPNYLKTVAPKTAKRIREYVNANQNLNKTIQFNSVAPVIGAGAVGGLLSDSDAEQY